jgi:plastocyanin
MLLAARSSRPGRRSAALAVLGVAGLLLVPACGSDDEAGAPSVSLVEGVEAPVSAIDNTFRPEALTVQAGTEVVFTNDGRTEHNVLPVEGTEWGVQTEDFAPDAEYRHRFTEPGTYAYYCSLHGTKTNGMVGTIEVTG